MTKHTPGPWFVRDRLHPYGDGSKSHVEREIYTQQIDPQLKGHLPVVCMSIGIGINGEKAISFVHIEEANARLISAAPDLLEACQTFSEWLRREEAGFDHKTHDRKTPEGEAAWREWYYENIAICGFAQELVRDAIAKATGEQE